jgi:hypothetical protein
MIPIVNLKSKKITGVKENTFEYFHEKAHLEFNDSSLGMNVQYFQEISEFYTIIFIVLTFFLDFFKWFCLIGIICMLSFFTFEEVYCNIKANKELEELGTTKQKI